MRLRVIGRALGALAACVVTSVLAASPAIAAPPGVVIKTFGKHDPTIDTIVRQPDGKLLVGFDDEDFANEADRWGLARFTAGGKLDKGFGKGGYSYARPGAKGFEDITAIDVEADGKITVAGQSERTDGSGSIQIGLARFLPSGRLDTSFGNGGTTLISGPPPDEYESAGMVELPSGSYVVAGVTVHGTDAQRGFLMRATHAGQLDTSFGDNGFVIANDNGSRFSEFEYLALRPDGNLLVSGFGLPCRPDCAYPHVFAALDLFSPDGIRSPSWANGGSAIADAGPQPADGTVHVSYQHLLPLADGGGAMSFATTDGKIGLASYGADGTPRSGFGSGGVATRKVLRHEAQSALLQRSGGGYLVVGSGNTAKPNANPHGKSYAFAIAYAANGGAGKGFGRKGVRKIKEQSLGFWLNDVAGAVSTPGGKTVVVANGLAYSRASHNVLALFQLKANGALDTSFGG